MPKKLPADIDAQVVRLIGMGWTTHLIASELHIGQPSVVRIAAAHGVRSHYVGGRVNKNPHGAGAMRFGDESKFRARTKGIPRDELE